MDIGRYFCVIVMFLFVSVFGSWSLSERCIDFGSTSGFVSPRLSGAGWGNSTSKMAENESEPVAERVEPVFFINSDVDQEEGNSLTVWEICTAVSEVVSGGKKSCGCGPKNRGTLESVSEEQFRLCNATFKWYKPAGFTYIFKG